MIKSHIKENDKFIGLAKLELKSKNEEKAELGFMISPDFWGKRIGSVVGEKLITVAQT